MISSEKTQNTVGVREEYTAPEFTITALSDQDIILTSLKTGGNELDLGGLGTFEWF